AGSSGPAPPAAARPGRRAGGRQRLPRSPAERVGARGGGRASRRRGRHRHARGAGTAMKLEQTFEVQAPLEQVWEALLDLERGAPCLPGASITRHDEDGPYRGTFSVKLGPMTASYNGTIAIDEVDES